MLIAIISSDHFISIIDLNYYKYKQMCCGGKESN